MDGKCEASSLHKNSLSQKNSNNKKLYFKCGIIYHLVSIFFVFGFPFKFIIKKKNNNRVKCRSNRSLNFSICSMGTALTHLLRSHMHAPL